MKLALAALLLLSSALPAVAGGPVTGYRSRGGWAEEEKCYRKEYREEYVPGTSKSPGYVKKHIGNELKFLVSVNLTLIMFHLLHQTWGTPKETLMTTLVLRVLLSVVFLVVPLVELYHKEKLDLVNPSRSCGWSNGWLPS